MKMRRRILAAIFGAASIALAAATPPARAAEYDGPIAILVGFPPGGATDIVARLLAPKLQESLGQNVIVENRAGAGGMMATQFLKAAAPTGATVMLTIDHSQVIVPLTFKAPGYDPVKDFTPLAGVASYYNALGVPGSLHINTLQEFGAWLKAHPDRANFGVPAAGSVPQFASLIVAKALGAPNAVVVPYRGGAPLMQDLLGGRVAAGVGSLTEMIEYHRNGQVKVLAVSGTRRSAVAPDIPTFEELGLHGISKNPWLAFVGPKGLPPGFVNRFTKAVEAALKDPDVIAKLQKMGNDVDYATPDQLRGWITSATEHWAPVIKDSGYVLQ